MSKDEDDCMHYIHNRVFKAFHFLYIFADNYSKEKAKRLNDGFTLHAKTKKKTYCMSSKKKKTPKRLLAL